MHITYYLNNLILFFNVSGMEALETSINYWEDALSSFTSQGSGAGLTLNTPEEAEFCRELQMLLDSAYLLQVLFFIF